MPTCEPTRYSPRGPARRPHPRILRTRRVSESGFLTPKRSVGSRLRLHPHRASDLDRRHERWHLTGRVRAADEPLLETVGRRDDDSPQARELAPAHVADLAAPALLGATEWDLVGPRPRNGSGRGCRRLSCRNGNLLCLRRGRRSSPANCRGLRDCSWQGGGYGQHFGSRGSFGRLGREFGRRSVRTFGVRLGPRRFGCRERATGTGRQTQKTNGMKRRVRLQYSA